VENGDGTHEISMGGGQNILGDVEIEDGNGASTFAVVNMTFSGNLRMELHGGADSAQIAEDTIVHGKTTIETGSGVDSVKVNNATFDKTFKLIDPDGAAGTFQDLGGNSFPSGSPKLITRRKH
jgi:hypothetical protein